MIEEDWRFYISGGGIKPGGPTSWYIMDNDQGRMITVTMDEEQLEGGSGS